MPKVRIGSTELEYIDSGNGDPVVFVHGGLGDLRSWAMQIEAFAERHRVVAYTRRHHFGSEDPSGGHVSLGGAADDLLALLEGLRLAPAHLIGSSYGAFTALHAAARRPEQVRSLVLGEPPVSHLLTEDPATRPVWDDFVSQNLLPAQKLATSGQSEDGVRLFIDGVIGQGAFDRLPPPVRQRMLDNAASFSTEQHPTDRFTQAEASRLQMPVLLVSGELSPGWFHTIDDRLQALLPNAQRTVIPAASHAMHGDNPAAYNEAVLSFLAKV